MMTISLAVAGAHMQGEPLNHELTERGASLVRVTRTAPLYRLYALATVPPKPGLIRVGPGGFAIEIELWEMPDRELGRFIAGISEPLGIGSIRLENGEWVKGFLCEACATATARDISHTGGWRYRHA